MTITLQYLAASSGCSQYLVSPPEVKTGLHKLYKWGALTHRGTKTWSCRYSTSFLAQACKSLWDNYICPYILFKSDYCKHIVHFLSITWLLSCSVKWIHQEEYTWKFWRVHLEIHYSTSVWWWITWPGYIYSPQYHLDSTLQDTPLSSQEIFIIPLPAKSMSPLHSYCPLASLV